MTTRAPIIHPSPLEAARIARAYAYALSEIAESARLSESQKPAHVEAAWRAWKKFYQGKAVWRVDGSDVLFLSESEAREGNEVWHRTTVKGCECRAVAEERLCWHGVGRVMAMFMDREREEEQVAASVVVLPRRRVSRETADMQAAELF